MLRDLKILNIGEGQTLVFLTSVFSEATALPGARTEVTVRARQTELPSRLLTWEFVLGRCDGLRNQRNMPGPDTPWDCHRTAEKRPGLVLGISFLGRQPDKAVPDSSCLGWLRNFVLGSHTPCGSHPSPIQKAHPPAEGGFSVTSTEIPRWRQQIQPVGTSAPGSEGHPRVSKKA